MTLTQRLDQLEKRIKQLEKKKNIKAPAPAPAKKSTRKRKTTKKKGTKKNFSMREYGWSSTEKNVATRHSAIDKALKDHGPDEVKKFFVKMSRMHNGKPAGVVFKADLGYINKQ